MNASQAVLPRSSLRCIVGTVAAMLPLPLMYLLELATRGFAYRDSGLFQLLMFLLLVSIPLIFLAALITFFLRLYRLSSSENVMKLRDVISAGIVAVFHGIYIVGFLLSPWPVAISGM